MSIHDRDPELWEIYNELKAQGLEPRWVDDNTIEFICPCCGDPTATVRQDKPVLNTRVDQ